MANATKIWEAPQINLESLYEQLSQTFPVEDVHPYGSVLVVPKEAFRSEWESQLRSEGIQIYTNSYNGRVCFFLRKKNSNSETLEGKSKPTPTSSEQPKPFVWNNELIEKLKALRLKGLGHRAIARELNLKPHQAYRKMKQLGLIGKDNSLIVKPKPKVEALNCESGNDGLFKEYLEASQLLYPRFKKACAVLLREASRVLENG